MRIILILLTALLISCSGNPTPEDKVKKELAWNSVLSTYIAEAQKCQPGSVQPSCIIDKPKARAAKNAISTYQAARTNCLAEGNCDVCLIIESIGEIASLIGDTSFNAECVETFDLESVFNELEEAPIEVIEE